LFKFKLRFNAYQREKTRQTKQNKTENEIEKALKLPPDLKQHACICRKDKSESKKKSPSPFINFGFNVDTAAKPGFLDL
jgi:hypothetical protein